LALDISPKVKLAFISSLKDPQLVAEAEKAKLEIDPIDGPGIEKMVNGLYEIEPAVVSRVKQTKFGKQRLSEFSIRRYHSDDGHLQQDDGKSVRNRFACASLIDLSLHAEH